MQNFKLIIWWLNQAITCKVSKKANGLITYKYVIKLLFLFSLYALQWETKAQNLIADSSFENYTNCPTGISYLNYLKFWKQLSNHGGTADFFHKCALLGNNISVPQNYFGYENAASGNGYVGIVLLHKRSENYREYIQTQLIDTLAKGRTYKVSFKYSLADSCNFSTNSLGIYFSDEMIRTDTPILGKNINVTPQLILNKDLNTVNGWERISFNYLAKGGEKYITLGNFLNDSATLTKNLSNILLPWSYIYIDDVCVYDTCLRPNILLPTDTNICNNESLLLKLNSNNSTFLWQDGDTNSSYVVTKERKYWVKVTNSCGSSYDTVSVKYLSPPALNLGNDSIICYNKTFELKPNSQLVNYLWQDGKTDSNYIVTKNGIYSLKVNNFCGEANDSIEVNFEENPTINLGNDTILCDDKELFIQLPKKYNYVWQDNRLDTFYNITKTGLYKVTASNYCGNFTDNIQVSFIDCNCTQYFIPNAFTPKNDGLNDWFYPIANCEPTKFSFSIYNRWGSEVFYTNNHEEKWDGKFNGKECQADVYFYTLDYQFPLTTTKSIKGTVTLIR